MATDNRTRLLFVTRKFPPSVGGMEALAASIWQALQGTEADCRLIALGGRQWWMPLWLPFACLRTLGRVIVNRTTVVLCGDALVHAALSPFLRLLGVRHSTMVMGLDLTWPFIPYQWVIRRTLPTAERVIAISVATAAVAHRILRDPSRVQVVRIAVPIPQVSTAERATERQALRERYGIGADATIVLALSRLVRRKGIQWFVAEVLPHVPHAVLLIAGDGPERGAIAAEVAQSGLGERCRLLGQVDARTRESLMRGTELFVQPNISVRNDIEGFGLVAVEAAGRGAFVLAADIDGLRDAVIDQRTGLLLPSGDAAAWRVALTRLTGAHAEIAERASRFQQECRELFDPDRMGHAILSAVDGATNEDDSGTTPR